MPSRVPGVGPQDAETSRLVHERFAAQAARTPSAVAVICGAETATYAEVEERANRLAELLRAAGAGPGGVVAVKLGRNVDLATTILGVAKSGAAYLPLDPAYPAARCEYMMKTAGARVVVTSSSLLDADPSAGPGPAVPVLIEQARLGGPPPHHDGRGQGNRGQGNRGQGNREQSNREQSNREQSNREQDNREQGERLLYVVYTSGSTGRPKGVAVPHRALLNLFDWYWPDTGMGSGDGQLASHSISFDPAALEMLFPLLNGARVIIATEDVRAHPDALLDLIAGTGTTVMNVTPSLLHRLLDEPAAPQRLASLRLVVCGGEKLGPSLRDRFLAALPGTRLVNHYGPTETTIFATSWDCTAGDGEVVPIGRPVGGVRAYVVSEDLELVPPGSPGELCLGGAGLARGYANLPGLTAAAFLPDPFGGVPGARLYRTGDVVRRRDDGALEFLGRRDEQIKLHGFRIEPGEIEVALARHPAVRQAAVVVRKGLTGDPVLAAFAEHDGTAEAGEIRSYLQEHLPGFMVPGYVELVGALPRTVTGKVDKELLPGLPAAVVRTRPRTSAEQAIADIWASILGLPEVDVHDDFFTLGGDSLLATRVILRMRRAFGVEVPLLALFLNRSVATLAAAMDEQAPQLPGGSR